MKNRDENWAIGSAYEPYVGRWSRLVAREFLRWLAVPPGMEWLDAGCGTGALTETILREAEPAAVTGIDTAEGFVAYAREHVQDARASFRVADAMDLPFDDEMFGAVVSGLALNFIPRQDVALAEMVRVTKRGGIVAAYVWDYAGEMQMMRAVLGRGSRAGPGHGREGRGPALLDLPTGAFGRAIPERRPDGCRSQSD